MRKTEIILIGVLCFSAVFILNGFTKISSTLLLISSSLLAILYFAFGFLLINNKHLYKIFSKSTYEDLNTLKIILSIFLGFVFSNIIIGILFKLMLWPASEPMIMTSGLTIIVGLIVLVIIQLVTHKILFVQNLRYFIWTVFFAIIYLMPYRTLIEARYLQKYPDYSNAMSRYYENRTLENQKLFEEENQKYHELKMSEFGERGTR
ncbi:MAG: hypothetical protein PSX81_15295 [bacterium]|nr:hypothetical protein [bacterium]